MEKLNKEFKLELIINKRTGCKYIRVTNRETNKVSYIWNNNNTVYFCGHAIYFKTTGKELIKQLNNK